jgi:hypothetical protein
MKVLNNSNPSIIADKLWSQIEQLRTLFDQLGKDNFSTQFKVRFDAKLAELKPNWDEKWRELCDGKLLLEHLRQQGIVHGQRRPS